MAFSDLISSTYCNLFVNIGQGAVECIEKEGEKDVDNEQGIRGWPVYRVTGLKTSLLPQD